MIPILTCGTYRLPGGKLKISVGGADSISIAACDPTLHTPEASQHIDSIHVGARAAYSDPRLLAAIQQPRHTY